jgi:hypothetical protein
MSARMTAAKKAFIPSVGPVRTLACLLIKASCSNAACRAMTTRKFAPGMTSGAATEIAGRITTQCVYDSMLSCTRLLPLQINIRLLNRCCREGGQLLWTYLTHQEASRLPVGTNGGRALKLNLQSMYAL